MKGRVIKYSILHPIPVPVPQRCFPSSILLRILSLPADSPLNYISLSSTKFLFSFRFCSSFSHFLYSFHFFSSFNYFLFSFHFCSSFTTSFRFCSSVTHFLVSFRFCSFFNTHFLFSLRCFLNSFSLPLLPALFSNFLLTSSSPSAVFEVSPHFLFFLSFFLT
jgi:hypothetical protein